MTEQEYQNRKNQEFMNMHQILGAFGLVAMVVGAIRLLFLYF